MEDQASKACCRQPRDEVEQELKKMYLASIIVVTTDQCQTIMAVQKVPEGMKMRSNYFMYKDSPGFRWFSTCEASVHTVKTGIVIEL